MIIEDIDSLTSSIRKILIDLSQIDGKFVRNALSEYGASLDKRTQNSVFESISASDLIIFFELSSDTNLENESMSELDESISYFMPMKVRVIVYGKASFALSSKMIAKARSSKYRDKMIKDGMYLNSVSKAESIHEFKNDVMWLRTDFDIYFASHVKIDTHDFEYDIKQFDIKVKEFI